jgi:hypothetical protein
MDSSSDFEKLPKELQQLIFSYINIPTAGKIARLSKSFKNTAEEKLWKPMLQQTGPETFFKTPISSDLNKILGITPTIFKDLNKAFSFINKGKMIGKHKPEGLRLITTGCSILLKMPFNEFVNYYFPFYVLKITRMNQPLKITDTALELVKRGAGHDPYCMLLYGEILHKGLPTMIPTSHQKNMEAPSYIKQAIFVLKKHDRLDQLWLDADTNLNRTMALVGEGAADVIKELAYSKLTLLTTEQLRTLCFCKNSKQFLTDDIFVTLQTLNPEQIITWATLYLDHPKTTAKEVIKLSPENIKEINDFFLQIGYHIPLGLSADDLQTISKNSLENLLIIGFNESRVPIAHFINIIKLKNNFTDLEKTSKNTFHAIKVAIGKNFINADEILQKYTLIQLNEALNKFGSDKWEAFGQKLAATKDKELDELLAPPTPSSPKI